MAPPAPGRSPVLHSPRRLLRRFAGLTLAAVGLCVLGLAGSAWASHGRGTTISVTVADDGTASVVLDERTHAAGGCVVGDPYATGSMTLLSVDPGTGARTEVQTYNEPSTCYRSAGDFVEARTTFTIPMAGMADGMYVARHQGNAKVNGIINVNGGASATSWSSEAQFRKVTGTATGSPTFGVDLPFGMAIGYVYSQNLAVTDPDGGTVTARSLCCNAGDPDYAVSTDVIQTGAEPERAVPENQIVIPAETTESVALGQYVEFKVRVTDDDGEYSDLDMVLSPTENDPPTFEPPEHTSYAVIPGTVTTIPLQAEDSDAGQSISFSLSGQPSWVTLTQTPGNPATGTLDVEPPPGTTGRFVVNVNANDDDPALQSTSSFTLTFVVGVPDRPQDLTATEGDGGVVVTWDEPVDNGVEVTGYRIEHREAGSIGAFTVINGATSPTTLTGLAPGSTHEVRVIATSAEGDGVPATTTVAVSPSTAPGAVRSIAAQPTTTGAMVTWQPPASDGGAPISGYLVEHRLAGGDTWVSAGEVTTTAVDLTGLRRGATHEVRISAINEAGTGPWTTAEFRTLGIPRSGSSTVVMIRDGEPVNAPLYTGPTVAPLVSVTGTPSGEGSWAATAEGHVYTAGDASYHGSMGSQQLNSPITGIAPTVTGDGYYLVAADGGVFAFGDADFHGSMGDTQLNQPVQGLVPSCTGRGYYLVALDGGVFAFGDADFHGSMGGTPLNRGMLGIAPNCERDGYWTFAADGGVFSFGSSQFFGSLGSNPPAAGVVGMTPMPDSRGYWLIAGDGRTYPFGSAADD